MDELIKTMQTQLDADADHWYVQEDADSWQLFRGMYQIIKAPKHSTPFAEYWPTPADSARIVAALNTLDAVTADRDALRSVVGHLRADVLAVLTALETTEAPPDAVLPALVQAWQRLGELVIPLDVLTLDDPAGGAGVEG